MPLRDVAVEVRGLADFRRELKAANAAWPRELRKTNKAAAELVANDARGKASSLLPVQQKVAPSIRAAGEQLYAKVLAGGSSFPALLAMGALLGAKHYKQFPPWVGSDWVPGGPGGPYAISDAIDDTEGEFIETYARMIDDLYRRAFPN